MACTMYQAGKPEGTATPAQTDWGKIALIGTLITGVFALILQAKGNK